MLEVLPSLSCSHAFHLEFQAVSPGYRIVVQPKWDSINFINSMEIFIHFNHVSSCSCIVEAWKLRKPSACHHIRDFSVMGLASFIGVECSQSSVGLA